MKWVGIAFLVCLSTVAWAKEDVGAAREDYRNGSKMYDLGKYIDAAHEYELAYENKDDPTLLFNIGQAYRAGGDYPAALRAYKSFLRRVPDATNRPGVEARIAELQKAVDQQERAKVGPPDGTFRPPPPGKTEPETTTTTTTVVTAPPPQAPVKTPIYKRWWLWTSIAGAVAVGVGVGLGVGLGTSGTSNFGPTVKDFGPAAVVQF